MRINGGDALIRTAAKTVCLAAFALGLSQCAKPEVPMSNYAYDVVITLTPAAAAKVTAAKDHIVAQAHYYGLATKASRDRADSIGQVPLGDANNSGDADIRKINMDFSVPTADLSDLGEKQAFALIVVYTTLPVGAPDDMLICTHFRGPVPGMDKPVEISCDLNPRPN